MNIGRKIDHIVYAVPDLSAACDELEELLGVRPVFGGYHDSQGTKNALLNLGNQCYLELLAVDEANTKIEAPRWMGVDLIQHPRITRWAIKSDNLEQDGFLLNSHNSNLGKIQTGQRKTAKGDLLKWRMILPTAHPVVDILPFMVDWRESSHHPTDVLSESCQLIEVKVFHPKALIMQEVLAHLDIELQVQVAEKAGIEIVVEGLKGSVKFR